MTWEPDEVTMTMTWEADDMTSELTPVRDGVRRVLEGIPGLRVIDHTPDTWSDFPLVVIAFASARINVTLAGADMEGEITLTLMTSGANLLETLTDLDPLIESVDAVVSADTSLGGAVHYIALDRIENIGMRNMGPQRCGVADLYLRFMAG